MHKYPLTAPFKRGDTFTLRCTYRIDGTASSLDGVTIRSQVNYSTGSKVCDLVATPHEDQIGNPGLFYLVPVEGTDTKLWKAPADLLCDIEFSQSGIIFSTNTFQIPLEKDITI